MEIIKVVFGADRFQQRIGHLTPALHHVQRLVERIGILDGDHRFKRFAIGGQLQPLDDM